MFTDADPPRFPLPYRVNHPEPFTTTNSGSTAAVTLNSLVPLPLCPSRTLSPFANALFSTQPVLTRFQSPMPFLHVTSGTYASTSTIPASTGLVARVATSEYCE